MAKKIGKSKLAAKLGAEGRKAHEAHKSDETNFGAGGDLPAGIEGGIAQLVECKFDTYAKGDNVGEYYFYAAGIVKRPTVHDGVRVEGLRTSIMEPLCETPNRTRETIEDHLSWVYNELRKLGVDTDDIDFDDLESVVEALKEEQPHFRFRTWQGEATEQYPNPRVNHQWRGACEYEEDDVDDVVDETDDAEEAEEAESEELDGDAADAGDVDAQQAITAAAEEAGVDPDQYDTWTEVVDAITAIGDDDEEEEESEEEEEEDEEIEADISTQDLGTHADEDDEDAQGKLTEQAAEFGLDPDEYGTWTELAKAIVEARIAGDGEEEEEVEPEKGDVFLYKPPRKKQAVECEVTAVFSGKKTVNLKNLDDETVYKSVSWSSLESE